MDTHTIFSMHGSDRFGHSGIFAMCLTTTAVTPVTPLGTTMHACDMIDLVTPWSPIREDCSGSMVGCSQMKTHSQIG